MDPLTLDPETAKTAGAGGFMAIAFSTLWAFFNGRHRQQQATNSTLFRKLDLNADSLNQHQLHIARTGVTRDELAALRNYMDGKFDNLQKMIYDLGNKMHR